MARVQAIQAEQEPGPDDGINYWRTQPASYDGVLGEHLRAGFFMHRT